MKSTMKKLLSLMLVAILLVSAVPFQAAAATDDVEVTVKVWLDDKQLEDRYLPIPAGGSQKLDESAVNKVVSKTDGRTFAWFGSSGNDADGQIIYADKVDEDYYVTLKITTDKSGESKEDPTPTPAPEVEHKAATVKVQVWVDGEEYGTLTHEFPIAANGSQTLNKELAETLVKSDKEFVEWRGYANETSATDQTISADDVNARLETTPDYHVNLYVKTKKQEETTKPSETVKPITVKIVDGDGNAIANQFEVTPANGKSAVVQDILSARWNKNWADSYTFKNASTENDTTMSLTDSANVGETLTIVLEKKVAETKKYDLTVGYGDDHILLTLDMNYEGGVDKYVLIRNRNLEYGEVLREIKQAGLIPERTNYNFDGWYWNAECNSSSKVVNTEHVYGTDHNITFYAKWTRKSTAKNVLLKVYINGKTTSDNAIIDISSYADDDGKIGIGEVKSVLSGKYSYSGYDGLYTATTWKDFKKDGTDGANFIEVDLTEDTYLYIMLYNAERKSTSTTTSTSKADSSNPKTGDQIYVAVTILAVSAAALAAVYYVSKKREAR